MTTKIDDKNFLKVVHIMPQIGIGGAEKQLYELIRNSPSEVNHKVLYYSESADTDGYKLYDSAGIDYSKVERFNKNPIGFLWRLSREIKLNQPDIVHCWLYSGVVWGRWAAVIAGCRNIIVSYRARHLKSSGVLRILEMFSPKRVRFLANSNAVADTISYKLGIKRSRFNVIYNGIDLEKFFIKSKLVADVLNLGTNTTVITMVGRLIESKNYQMLLKVADRCKNSNLDVCFLIVGHGNLESELKELSKKLNVEGIVHFWGLRTDIPEILCSSDIFCFTTNTEGFPNALIEAMAAGLPVVTTDFKGVRELIVNESLGKIVPLNDDAAAYESIKYYIQNPNHARKTAIASQKFVKDNFDLKVMVNNTISFYKKMLNSNV